MGTRMVRKFLKRISFFAYFFIFGGIQERDERKILPLCKNTAYSSQSGVDFCAILKCMGVISHMGIL